MQYKEKLVSFIKEGSIAELMAWIQTKPLLKQVNIAKDFRQLMQKILMKSGKTDELENLKAFDSFIEEYQEKILDAQLASLKADLALQEMRKRHIAEMHEKLKSTKNLIIDCILLKCTKRRSV